MAITGNLDTMPLSDLLDWVARAKKSGGLRVRRGRGEVRFHLRSGRIAGCVSNDPPNLLGQFLLARGKIDEDTLQGALARQEATGEGLPAILEELGVVDREEMDRYIAAKAEETVFKLFEGDGGHFELDPSAQPAPNMIRVNLGIEEVLLRGAKRQDELRHMKEVFSDPGMVLCRTERPLRLDPERSPMAHKICELVDGSRTFAEIVLQSRAAEFPATKFLYELYRRGIICTKDVREIRPEQGTPEAICELAQRMVDRGEHEDALDVLCSGVVQHPQHEGLRQELCRVEAAYVDRMYQSDLAPYKVPTPRISRRDLEASRPLSANELFLLDMIQPGNRDVRSLVRVAPLHELDVLRALRSLLDKDLVKLQGDETALPIDLPEVVSSEPEPSLRDLGAEIEESLDGIIGTVERL